jgi:hypothetical protein
MKICDGTTRLGGSKHEHDEICIGDYGCPLCEALAKIGDLEDEISELKTQLESQ